MKRYSIIGRGIRRLLFCASVLQAVSCTGYAGVGETDAAPPHPLMIRAVDGVQAGVVLLRFGEDYADSLAAAERTRASGVLCSGVAGVDRFLSEVGAVSMRPLFNVQGRFAERKRRAGMHLWYEVRFDESVPVADVCRRLRAERSLRCVEFCMTPERIVSEAVPAAECVAQTRSAAAGDPRLADQWHYVNTGDYAAFDAVPGADINLSDAWSMTAGSPDVTVAVLDSGVRLTHEDLTANLWVNAAELNGTAGVDDDGNGYVDDIYGYNFAPVQSGEEYGRIVADDHGTHVAGTIAAVSGNGRGVAGVAGGSGHGDGVRLMTCQVFMGSATGSFARAFEYAADNGAVIANCSWGYAYGLGATSAAEWRASADKVAIDYFIEHAGCDEAGRQSGPLAGGLVVFAAGNYGYLPLGGEPTYPPAYDAVVSVAAMGPDYRPAYYTCYGASWVDVTAPGGDMQCLGTEAGILSTIATSDRAYGYEQGTSMACPHVSGIAALAVSLAAQYGIPLTAERLRGLLLESTHPIDAYCTGEKSFPAYDQYNRVQNYTIDLSRYRGAMGSGCIDAALVLRNLLGEAAVAPSATAALPTVTLALDRDAAGLEIALHEYFTHPLVERYEVSSSDEAVVTAVESDGRMTLTPRRAGNASVSVTAIGYGGDRIGQRFAVFVRERGNSAGGWL